MLLVASLFAQGTQPVREYQLERSFTCAGCEGAGITTTECTACAGKGKGPCLDCVIGIVTPLMLRMADIEGRLDGTSAAEHEKIVEELRLAQARLRGGFIQLGRRPGELACSLLCRDGRPILRASGTCALCKGKGKHKCSRCKGKGVASCYACAGKRKVREVCAECMGSGRSIDLGVRDARVTPACPWCDGKEFLECSGCDESGKLDSSCAWCAGAGKILCSPCRGSRRRGCPSCSCTGENLTLLGESSTCKPCDGKGVTPCTNCKSGKLECPRCKGKKKGHFDCRLCGGNKIGLCLGCYEGSDRAWRVVGTRFQAAEEWDLAALYLRIAVERLGAYNEKLLSRCSDDPKAREALRRALVREYEALKRRVGAVEKARRG